MFLNYVYNPLKYKKLHFTQNTTVFNFSFTWGLFVTKVYEYFNKLTAFECKFDLIWVCFCCCHALKVEYLCLSLLLNITLVLPTAKKASGLSFCSRFEICVLLVSKLLDLLFMQSRIISLLKEFFYSQRNFSWSRKFSTKKLIKKIFHKIFNQKNFHSRGNFLQKIWSRKFSTTKQIFHKKSDLGNSSQSMKFSTRKFYKKIWWKFFSQSRKLSIEMFSKS